MGVLAGCGAAASWCEARTLLDGESKSLGAGTRRCAPSYKGNAEPAICSKRLLRLRPADFDDKFFGEEQRIPELASAGRTGATCLPLGHQLRELALDRPRDARRNYREA